VQFQDEISLDKRKAGARAAVQEKKMAILENALRELPQNESLILAYMDIARDKLE
jgi:hypothetical protein